MDKAAIVTDDEKAVANLVLAAAKRHDATALNSMRDNINARDCIGETALHYACHTGDREAARLLLEAGADLSAVSAIGQTALGLAMVNGSGAIAEMLLQRGANPNQLIDTDTAPLTLAVNSGDVEMTRLLLRYKASMIPLPPSKDLPAPILAACEGQLNVLRLMIEDFGADVNMSVDGGATPLTAAIAGKHDACYDYLIEKGADIGLPSPKGLTPIFAAAAANNPDVIEDLLKRGISVDGVPNQLGYTPLLAAANQNALKAAKVLLDNGAKIDPVGIDGNTARQTAEARGNGDMVALIDAEARRRHLIAVDQDSAQAHGGVSGTVKVRRPLSLRKPAPPR